jgi:uncharacterized protein
MDAIYIPELAKALNSTEECEFKEFLPGLSTLMPISGSYRVVHQGNYLDVSAQVEAIMTLTCNRCLKQYNYRLRIHPSEAIWLDETAQTNVLDGIEQEIDFEDLVETLSPYGYFEPGTWLYEQLCLAIPSKQLCDENCPGIVLESDTEPESQVDSRWAALKALQGKLPSPNSSN